MGHGQVCVLDLMVRAEKTGGMRTYSNPAARTWSSGATVTSVRDFHRTLPGYAPTPLVDLPRAARELGVARVVVKDESARLGLPAFKMLGASWACHQVVERHPGAELVSATDGNHGRAIARMATHLGTTASGVGSLAQAVITHYRQAGTEGRTRILVVDPDTAACTVESLAQGTSVTVATGESIMAGLNCGTLSSLAWPVLRDGCDAAITVTDEEALQASDDLLAQGVSSGPSGAATYAGARAALRDADLWRDLDLPDDATVVLLSTEGRQDDE